MPDLDCTEDELWAFVSNWIGNQSIDDRFKARRVLIRRLQHPEAFNAGLKYNQEQLEKDKWAERNPRRLRYDSPKCICGASRSTHDEEGLCESTGCNGFVSEAS